MGAGTDQLLDWQLGDRVVTSLFICAIRQFEFCSLILLACVLLILTFRYFSVSQIAWHNRCDPPTTGTLEVVFDKTFIGGNTLHGLCKNGRGRVSWTDLLAVALERGGASKSVSLSRRSEEGRGS